MLQQVMTEPGKIIFREIPVPEIGDGQVWKKLWTSAFAARTSTCTTASIRSRNTP